MTTNYQRGAQTEYRACQELERVGYTTLRSAGSKGAIDIVAWNHNGVRFIQLKRTKSYYQREYEQDKEQLQELPTPPNTTREIWVWRDNVGWITQEVV